MSDAGSGIALVTVGGVDAEVAADGSFQAELAVDRGVSLVEVIARDGAGNQARDVRAVLSGRSSADNVIARGLLARVGPAGYGLVTEAVRSGLSAADLSASGALMSLAVLPVPDLSGIAEVSGLAAVPGDLVLAADLAAP